MTSVDELAAKIHETATEHGFWDNERNFGEMLMLVVSECAEALEEDRAGRPLVYWKCKSCGYVDHNRYIVEEHDIPQEGSVRKFLAYLGWPKVHMPCSEVRLKPEGALVEIADAIIRLMDTGHHLADKTAFSLGWVIEHKMDYNDSREHMHGKAY